jgi:NAD(P)-dependent dehydrogenase (short-subunit alcohol dehydrogenase family)
MTRQTPPSILTVIKIYQRFLFLHNHRPPPRPEEANVDTEQLERLFSVQGKTVLITGGSSGIGLMMANGFVRAGARVYITGRKAEQLEAARKSLSELGDVRAIQGDVSTVEGLEAVVKTIAAQEPRLHVLINNAGITWGAPVEKFPASAFDTVLAVNVRAPFQLIQALLPQLAGAATPDDPARVINIGSVYGVSGQVQMAWSYGASKAAIHHLTVSLAAELAPRHILVNAIAPGFFPSKMTNFVMKDEHRRDEMMKFIPLARPGAADDVAGLAIFLSSRAGAYMTGTIIPLDGGVLASR